MNSDPIDWRQRAVDAEEALRVLIESSEQFLYWVKHNPDCAADPCAESYNLWYSLREARVVVGIPQPD